MTLNLPRNPFNTGSPTHSLEVPTELEGKRRLFAARHTTTQRRPTRIRCEASSNPLIYTAAAGLNPLSSGNVERNVSDNENNRHPLLANQVRVTQSLQLRTVFRSVIGANKRGKSRKEVGLGQAPVRPRVSFGGVSGVVSTERPPRGTRAHDDAGAPLRRHGRVQIPFERISRNVLESSSRGHDGTHSCTEPEWCLITESPLSHRVAASSRVHFPSANVSGYRDRISCCPVTAASGGYYLTGMDDDPLSRSLFASRAPPPPPDTDDGFEGTSARGRNEHLAPPYVSRTVFVDEQSNGFGRFEGRYTSSIELRRTYSFATRGGDGGDDNDEWIPSRNWGGVGWGGEGETSKTEDRRDRTAGERLTTSSPSPSRAGGRGGAGYWGGVKGGGCGDTRADEEVVEPRNAGLSVVDVVVVVAAVAVSEDVVAAVTARCWPLYLEAVLLLGLLDGQGGRRGGSTGGGS
ncbi:hypothetical protein WN55_08870 [Dufourea novaeangliae]|uniref:Uncharacterized protein n=1 Tax=Dufourea novaeangliae TaxID=178035 RepID=A0A154P4Y0_DUFNO|nr:hypothetical protein WN55_08870 [Dufourea novaeangliae]